MLRSAVPDRPREAFRNPRITDVQPGVAEALLHRVLLVFPFEMRHLRCETTEFLLTKAQNLPEIPNGRTRAVSNDVRSHGCSTGSMALEDILDHFLSFGVAGRSRSMSGHSPRSSERNRS